PIIKKESSKLKFLDILFFVLTIASFVYFYFDYERIANRLLFVDELFFLDYFFGISIIVLIMEVTRRTMGWPLVIVSLFFIIYTLFGQYFPGILKHSGVSFDRYIEHMYLTTEGIWGMPVGVSASYVFLFV